MMKRGVPHIPPCSKNKREKNRFYWALFVKMRSKKGPKMTIFDHFWPFLGSNGVKMSKNDILHKMRFYRKSILRTISSLKDFWQWIRDWFLICFTWNSDWECIFVENSMFFAPDQAEKVSKKPHFGHFWLFFREISQKTRKNTVFLLFFIKKNYPPFHRETGLKKTQKMTIFDVFWSKKVKKTQKLNKKWK